MQKKYIFIQGKLFFSCYCYGEEYPDREVDGKRNAAYCFTQIVFCQ